MRIAIIEDEPRQAEILKSYLKKCFEENDFGDLKKVDVVCFSDGVSFLTGYKCVYDVIFMDIEMPMMDGVRTAKKLREIDPTVTLVFVTRMAQYAISGYEVSAFDYVLKPINYNRFSSMLKRLLRNKRLRDSENSLQVKTQYGMKRIPLNRISYIEITGHKILLHADETVVSWGTLNEIEKLLPPDVFIRVSNCFIVNLAFVSGAKGYELFIGDYPVIISRNRKAEVLSKLAAFVGGNQ